MLHVLVAIFYWLGKNWLLVVVMILVIQMIWSKLSSLSSSGDLPRRNFPDDLYWRKFSDNVHWKRASVHWKRAEEIRHFGSWRDYSEMRVGIFTGEAIRKRRTALGWSQEDLAEKVGMRLSRPLDASTIHRWESEKSRPQPLHALALQRAFEDGDPSG